MATALVSGEADGWLFVVRWLAVTSVCVVWVLCGIVPLNPALDAHGM
jgi:hypothetical protein